MKKHFQDHSLVCLIKFNISNLITQNKIKRVKRTNKIACTHIVSLRATVKCRFPHCLERRHCNYYMYICTQCLRLQSQTYRCLWLKHINTLLFLFICAHRTCRNALNTCCNQIHSTLPFRCQGINMMVMF